MSTLTWPTVPTKFDVIAVRTDATRAILHVHGDVDAADAESLSAIVLGHLDQGRRFVRLDLSGVRSLDRRAAAALLRTHNAFLDARGTLILTGIGPRVAELLRSTNLDRILLVADTY